MKLRRTGTAVVLVACLAGIWLTPIPAPAAQQQCGGAFISSKLLPSAKCRFTYDGHQVAVAASTIATGGAGGSLAQSGTAVRVLYGSRFLFQCSDAGIVVSECAKVKKPKKVPTGALLTCQVQAQNTYPSPKQSLVTYRCASV